MPGGVAYREAVVDEHTVGTDEVGVVAGHGERVDDSFADVLPQPRHHRVASIGRAQLVTRA